MVTFEFSSFDAKGVVCAEKTKELGFFGNTQTVNISVVRNCGPRVK
jgi:hypothetical protein